MKVFYLHHSGFAVLLDDLTLIFDPISRIPSDIIEKNKRVIFFVSHGHGDHYDQNIWDYNNRNTNYVISDDIHSYHKGQNIIYTGPYNTIDIDGIQAETFGSTDQGISVLVEAEGKNIFFAGDLNWWAWDTAKRPHIDPEAEERDYKVQISKLKAALAGRELDLAFVPVDPRLDTEGGELKAALYFIEELHPKKLVPMHFWGDFDVIKRLKAALPEDCSTEIGMITARDEFVKF